MRVQITERHCDVPKSVLERTERIAKGLKRFESRATVAEVVYSEERHTRKAEIIIHVDGSEPVVAHGEGRDYRTALDQAAERVRRRASRQRERRREHKAPRLAEGLPEE